MFIGCWTILIEAVSVEIAAGCGYFAERGQPCPRVPSDNDLADMAVRAPFGCGFAALYCNAELHAARRWKTQVRGTNPTLRRLQVGDTAD